MFSIQAPWKCGRRAVTHQCSFARGKPVSSPRPRFYTCITHSVRFDRADQHMAFGAENYSEAEGEGGGTDGGRRGAEEALDYQQPGLLDCFHVSDPQMELREIRSDSGSSM